MPTLEQRITDAQNWQEVAYDGTLKNFREFVNRSREELKREEQRIDKVETKSGHIQHEDRAELNKEIKRFNRKDEVLGLIRAYQSLTLQAVRPKATAIWGLWENYVGDVLVMWGTVVDLSKAEKEVWEHKELVQVANDALVRIKNYEQHIEFLKTEKII